MCYARRQRSSWARIKLSNVYIISCTSRLQSFIRAIYLSFFYFQSIYTRYWRDLYFALAYALYFSLRCSIFNDRFTVPFGQLDYYTTPFYSCQHFFSLFFTFFYFCYFSTNKDLFSAASIDILSGFNKHGVLSRLVIIYILSEYNKHIPNYYIFCFAIILTKFLW